MIELNPARLFQNAVVRAHNAVFEKARPLAVRKGVVVQTLQLAAEVGDERGFVVDLQIFIPLRAQKPQKLLLQRRLALVAVRPAGIRRVLGHDCAFRGGGDDVELAHSNQEWLKTDLRLAVIYDIFSSRFRCSNNSMVKIIVTAKINFDQTFLV